MSEIMKTYQVLSALLSYPSQEIKAATDEMRSVLVTEGLVPKKELRGLEKLIQDFDVLDLYELQERYVLLFDRTRSLSLHLFEHVHGESRDRGQAMVDLKTLYAQSGLEIESRELPDFLPVFLEFLATQDGSEAQALLGEPISVLVALRERLEKRKTPYTAVFRALEAISNAQPEKKLIDELRLAPDDDANDLEALDAAWEDQPITFGGGAEGCPKVDQMLDRMGIEESGGVQNTRS